MPNSKHEVYRAGGPGEEELVRVDKGKGPAADSSSKQAPSKGPRQSSAEKGAGENHMPGQDPFDTVPPLQ